ncbi:hypothetical protein, partial [Massilia phosphatilytica]
RIAEGLQTEEVSRMISTWICQEADDPDRGHHRTRAGRPGRHRVRRICRKGLGKAFTAGD